MKITYDKNVDAMMILFSDSDIEETRDIAPGVYVDYDADGRMVGLEILKASQKYDLRGHRVSTAQLLYVAVGRGKVIRPQPDDSATPDWQESSEGQEVRTQLDGSQ